MMVVDGAVCAVLSEVVCTGCDVVDMVAVVIGDDACVTAR